VPVIDSFSFLTPEDKLNIFNKNPKRVVPQMAKWDTPVAATA
jgi:hypothetical protein